MVTLKTILKEKVYLPDLTASFKGISAEEIAFLLIYLKSNIYLELLLKELKEQLKDKDFKTVLEIFRIQYHAMLKEEELIEEIEILEQAKVPILLPGRNKNNE